MEDTAEENLQDECSVTNTKNLVMIFAKSKSSTSLSGAVESLVNFVDKRFDANTLKFKMPEQFSTLKCSEGNIDFVVSSPSLLTKSDNLTTYLQESYEELYKHYEESQKEAAAAKEAHATLEKSHQQL